MRTSLALTCVLLFSATPHFTSAAAAQVNYDRAHQNYLDLMAGRKQQGDLTPIELEEVRLLDQAARAQGQAGPDSKSRCVERNQSSPEPSTLETALLDLKCSQRPD